MGPQEFSIKVDRGLVLAAVEARQPMIVYRNEVAKCGKPES